MTHLIDSDSIADWLNRQPAVVASLAGLPPDGLAISIISHSEILEGILGARDPRAADRAFQGFLRGCPSCRSRARCRGGTPYFGESCGSGGARCASVRSTS